MALAADYAVSRSFRVVVWGISSAVAYNFYMRLCGGYLGLRASSGIP